jgi:hypothetical protein
MQTVTHDLLDKLANLKDSPIVSIHIPTHRAGRETTESRIHLKNSIDEARTMLSQRGLSDSEIDRRMAPLDALTDDHEYWQHQREGLSVFQYADQHIEVSLHETPEPLTHVGSHAHVTPLVSSLGKRSPFAALVVSGNRVDLFRVEGDRIEMVDVPDLPDDYEDLGKYIDAESQLQFHTGAPEAGTPRSQSAVFHGHGVGTESERKTRLAEFSRMIDEPVAKHLRNTDRLPLVVLAAEPMHTIYRENSEYKDIVDTDASGNLDHLSQRQILDVARDACRKSMPERDPQVLTEMKERLGSDGVLYELEDVLEAASDGKLKRLIGASDRSVWGKADLENAPRAVDAHPERRAEDEDLHNLAFVTAHRTGAEVYALPEDEMPDGRPLLGLRRY